MADVPPLLSDPLHAAWLTSTPSSADPADAVWLAEVGDGSSWLRLSSAPPTAGASSVLRSGAFRRRCFEVSADDADALEQGPVGCLLSVQLYVTDAAQQEDCRRWLDEEHVDRQLAVPGAQWYAGYESLDGEFNFLNLWGLHSPDVIDTVEWFDARETPWRDRLLERAVVRTERSLFAWEPVAGRRAS